MMEYARDIEADIKARLFESGKVSVLYGPRQVGKTILVKKILSDNESSSGYFNCEEQPVADVLASHNSGMMYAFFAGHPVIVLDEAQSVKNIGRALKILIDAHPELPIIATGSSSFDLANKINEPLTGRHYEYFLYPLSFNEIAEAASNRVLFENLETRLIYGSYPEIVSATTQDDARARLESLSTSYLYRDVFKFNDIRNPEVLADILRALAYQVGNEVSLNEIANLVGVDKKTVASYVRLLEQAFIIFRLPSFSRNLRNEIKQGKKYYFYDNGIISALTRDFRLPITGRDVGHLWENLMMSERRKHNQRHHRYVSQYFWRLRGAGELDLIEDADGELLPFEFKWKKTRMSASAANFVKTYGTRPVQIINKSDFIDFVI
ncbi:MAG: ATP-binding protein [Coriobacteriia bacterium]|nr:ATP-binding protein [Coriobacteriia bacterium]